MSWDKSALRCTIFLLGIKPGPLPRLFGRARAIREYSNGAGCWTPKPALKCVTASGRRPRYPPWEPTGFSTERERRSVGGHGRPGRKGNGQSERRNRAAVAGSPQSAEVAQNPPFNP